MKYIVLKTKVGDMEQRVPIIFPDFLVHSDVAKYVAGMLIRIHDRDPNITVSSAGFIELGDVKCYGESETCKVKSNPDRDGGLIEMFEYTNGLV